MSKRVISIASAMLFAFACVCFALGPTASEVIIGNAMHKVSFERLDREPPLFLAMDSVVAPAKDIASFSIIATFAENRVLKSLIVTLVSYQAFSASGELEWLFPAGEQVNLYGKTAAKPLKDGMTEYTITFFADLADFCDCSALTSDKNVLLKLYPRKGAPKEFELPSAFFQLLSDPAA
ncbi:MAG: hypothetical protein ACYC6C_14480 [Coriobacteriia bacterium]